MFNLELAIKEISKRTTRIESRLVKLANGMSVPIKGTPDIAVTFDSKNDCQAAIGNMDTELSTIVHHCHEVGVRNEWVDVYFEGNLAARLYIP